MSTSNVFKLLAKPIKAALAEKGFKKPTKPQEKAIPVILKGKNILLIAPTASGKTEAALLPVLSIICSTPSLRDRKGVKLLYITPLRALNRDMLDRFVFWCEKAGLTVSVRHGDTDASERRKQALKPPDVLITTPETLQALLTGRILRNWLKKVRWVVVDEVHELVESKRGAQLVVALERLRMLKGGDFQLICLSATIGSPELVAKFFSGVNREMEVIKVPSPRRMELKVEMPTPTEDDLELSGKLYAHPEVVARLRRIREIIDRYRSALLFVNTRSIAEVLASRFKVWDVNFPISVHHGSLSKHVRVLAEKELKNGKLKGLVCTSSLELGIDIGRIDVVIQYMSPRQVTRLVQRVGRAGHKVGKVAKGYIITADLDDVVEAAVICKLAEKGILEDVKPPDKPLDVLAHQVVGLLIDRRRWKIEEMFEFFRRVYPFRNLKLEELLSVLAYLHERWPRLAWVSFEDGVVVKPVKKSSFYEYYFENMSMIPDEKHYLVINEGNNEPVGILDEAFVAEYGEPGTKFICKGSVWRVVKVTGDRVYVVPVEDPTGAIPSWAGEEIPVSYLVAREVGVLRRRIAEMLSLGKSEKEVAEKISLEYPVNREVAFKVVDLVAEHLKQGLPVPDDKTVLVELTGELVVVHACFGTLVNRTLGRLLIEKLTEKLGVTLALQEDPYRIFITFPVAVVNTMKRFAHLMSAPPPLETTIKQVLRELTSAINTNSLASEMEKILRKSMLFKRRLIYVARRFGALKKWVSLGDISMKELLNMFEGTPIYKEALNEALWRDFDVKTTQLVLEKIKNGEIKVLYVSRETLSPIARIGLEKQALKRELIPPERMEKLLVETLKARLQNEVLTIICLDCLKWYQVIRVKDVNTLRCGLCGSENLGVSKASENLIRKIIEKNGKRLSRKEEKEFEHIKRTASLLKRYGKKALIALAARGVEPEELERVLSESRGEELFKRLLSLEREALKRRYW